MSFVLAVNEKHCQDFMERQAQYTVFESSFQFNVLLIVLISYMGYVFTE